MSKVDAQRRLAAILVADVVGYSRLMGLDEGQTLRLIKAARKEIVDPALRACRGRVVKTTGDGLLVEFPSAVEAVRCAAHVQHAMALRDQGVPEDRRIVFRVGVHQGDILGEGEDIFGDGVNVAARLETLCEPGGVRISARVQEDLEGRLDLPFEDHGEQQVKNIARPVRTYGLGPAAVAGLSLLPLDDPGPLDAAAAQAPARAKPRVWLGAAVAVLAVAAVAGWAGYAKFRAGDAIAKSDQPRIAVLAFDNLSGDLGLSAFADGLSEELITDLAEFGYYDVLARNTTFQYKGQAVDVPAIGRKLAADYVVEGSVRGSGDKLEVTAQLIDAKTGAHVWAQTFREPASGDRAGFQDDAARQISVAVGDMGSGVIAAKAVERSRDKPPEALSSVECIATQRRRDSNWGIPLSRVRACLEATVKRDPNNAEAWSALTSAMQLQLFWGEGLPPAEAQDLEKRAYLVPLMLAAATRAVALAPNKSFSHRAMVNAYWATCQRDRMRVEAERAAALNPNDADAQGQMGNQLAYAGDWEFGRQMAEKAIAMAGRSAPKWWHWAASKGYYHKGEYENAYKSFLLGYSDGSWLDQLHIIYTLPYLGRTEEAKAHFPELMKLMPGISVQVANKYHKMWCFDDDYIAKMDKALRMAGLRETAEVPLAEAAAKP